MYDMVNVNEPIFKIINTLFDKNENNINRFLGFFSYYHYVIGNYGLEGLDYVLKNLNYTGPIQKINVRYLMLINDTRDTIPQDFCYFCEDTRDKFDLFLTDVFNIYKLYLEQNSFLKINQKFIASNDYNSFIKFYNDLHSVFLNPQLFFNGYLIFPEVPQYFLFEVQPNFISFFGLSYDNIFLSTYLVIIFLLINLSFKITAAPFHF
jgi:hypothetical protein